MEHAEPVDPADGVPVLQHAQCSMWHLPIIQHFIKGIFIEDWLTVRCVGASMLPSAHEEMPRFVVTRKMRAITLNRPSFKLKIFRRFIIMAIIPTLRSS